MGGVSLKGVEDTAVTEEDEDGGWETTAMKPAGEGGEKAWRWWRQRLWEGARGFRAGRRGGVEGSDGGGIIR